MHKSSGRSPDALADRRVEDSHHDQTIRLDQRWDVAEAVTRVHWFDTVCLPTVRVMHLTTKKAIAALSDGERSPSTHGG